MHSQGWPVDDSAPSKPAPLLLPPFLSGPYFKPYVFYGPEHTSAPLMSLGPCNPLSRPPLQATQPPTELPRQHQRGHICYGMRPGAWSRDPQSAWSRKEGDASVQITRYTAVRAQRFLNNEASLIPTEMKSNSSSPPLSTQAAPALPPAFWFCLTSTSSFPL